MEQHVAAEHLTVIPADGKRSPSTAERSAPHHGYVGARSERGGAGRHHTGHRARSAHSVPGGSWRPWRQRGRFRDRQAAGPRGRRALLVAARPARDAGALAAARRPACSSAWRSPCSPPITCAGCFVLGNALFYGCAVHARAFPCSGTKLFGWLIIVLAGALLFTRPVFAPGATAIVDHALMGGFFGGAHLAYGGVPLRDRAKKDPGVNPETLLQIDRVIHEKGRLAIMSMLAASPELSFIELRETLQMTTATSPPTSAPSRKRVTSRWRRATGTAGG